MFKIVRQYILCATHLDQVAANTMKGCVYLFGTIARRFLLWL